MNKFEHDDAWISGDGNIILAGSEESGYRAYIDASHFHAGSLTVAEYPGITEHIVNARTELSNIKEVE